MSRGFLAVSIYCNHFFIFKRMTVEGMEIGGVKSRRIIPRFPSTQRLTFSRSAGSLFLFCCRARRGTRYRYCELVTFAECARSARGHRGRLRPQVCSAHSRFNVPGVGNARDPLARLRVDSRLESPRLVALKRTSRLSR